MLKNKKIQLSGSSMRKVTLQNHLALGKIPRESIAQAVVVQRVDNSIQQINHYPVDSVLCFVNIYPLHNDLSGG